MRLTLRKLIETQLKSLMTILVYDTHDTYLSSIFKFAVALEIPEN